MPYWGPMYLFWGWAIIVSVQGNFWEILLKLVLTGFCSASKQPNLQTKKDIVVSIIKIFGPNISSSALKDTEVDICVKHSWQKLYLKILMRETCLGFFNIEEISKVATLAASGGFLLKTLSLHVVHTKIFVWPSWIF